MFQSWDYFGKFSSLSLGVRTPAIIGWTHLAEVQTELVGRPGELLPHLGRHAVLVPVPGEEEAAVVSLDGDISAPVDQHVVGGGMGDNDPLLCNARSELTGTVS